MAHWPFTRSPAKRYAFGHERDDRSASFAHLTEPSLQSVEYLRSPAVAATAGPTMCHGVPRCQRRHTGGGAESET